MRRMLLHECLFVGLLITGIIIAIVLVSISQVITPNDVASLSRHPTLVIILSNLSLALPPSPAGGLGGGAAARLWPYSGAWVAVGILPRGRRVCVQRCRVQLQSASTACCCCF